MHRDHAPDGIGLTLSIGRRWRVRPPLQRSRVIWLAMRPVKHTWSHHLCTLLLPMIAVCCNQRMKSEEQPTGIRCVGVHRGVPARRRPRSETQYAGENLANARRGRSGRRRETRPLRGARQLEFSPSSNAPTRSGQDCVRPSSRPCCGRRRRTRAASRSRPGLVRNCARASDTSRRDLSMDLGGRDFPKTKACEYEPPTFAATTRRWISVTQLKGGAKGVIPQLRRRAHITPSAAA